MSVLIFIVILLILILVHEFGHFIIAKKSGIRVDEFGIGFPPRAATLWKKGETEYTLNWLPFGGFVKIFGETPDEESLHGPDKDRSFVNKPKIIQAAVLVGGVAFNMILAWLLLSLIFIIGTDFVVGEDKREHATDLRLVISSVLPESPADDVGLEPGDIVTSMKSGEEQLTGLLPERAVEFIAENNANVIDITVMRGDELITISATPEMNIVDGEPERAVLGISMTTLGFLQFQNPFLALKEGAIFTYELTLLVWDGLATLFMGIFSLNADFSDVAGPIGIVSVVGEAAEIGFTSLLFLTAIISINLAIINILPIPALDGGRLLFLIIEVVKGSPIKPSVANRIHAFFFALLILLILVVSYNDIVQLLAK